MEYHFGNNERTTMILLPLTVVVCVCIYEVRPHPHPHEPQFPSAVPKRDAPNQRPKIQTQPEVWMSPSAIGRSRDQFMRGYISGVTASTDFVKGFLAGENARSFWYRPDRRSERGQFRSGYTAGMTAGEQFLRGFTAGEQAATRWSMGSDPAVVPIGWIQRALLRLISSGDSQRWYQPRKLAFSSFIRVHTSGQMGRPNTYSEPTTHNRVQQAITGGRSLTPGGILPQVSKTKLSAAAVASPIVPSVTSDSADSETSQKQWQQQLQRLEVQQKPMWCQRDDCRLRVFDKCGAQCARSLNTHPCAHCVGPIWNFCRQCF